MCNRIQLKVNHEFQFYVAEFSSFNLNLKYPYKHFLMMMSVPYKAEIDIANITSDIHFRDYLNDERNVTII